jgi:hypothetical protein
MYTIYGTVVNLEIRNVLVPVIKVSKNAYMKMSCADLSPPKLNGDGGYLYQDFPIDDPTIDEDPGKLHLSLH